MWHLDCSAISGKLNNFFVKCVFNFIIFVTFLASSLQLAMPHLLTTLLCFILPAWHEGFIVHVPLNLFVTCIAYTCLLTYREMHAAEGWTFLDVYTWIVLSHRESMVHRPSVTLSTCSHAADEFCMTVAIVYYTSYVLAYACFLAGKCIQCNFKLFSLKIHYSLMQCSTQKLFTAVCCYKMLLLTIKSLGVLSKKAGNVPKLFTLLLTADR